jgi:dipeptidyl aminopeptidase/acylaminoacyl peptidase
LARLVSLSALLVVLWSAATAGVRGEDEPAQAPAEPVFRLEGPFVPGYASVPWHAVFTPDGRRLAVVDGYEVKRVTVHDAATGAVTWQADVGVQPANHRPAFTRDGERLVLIEGVDLVVRERRETEWLVAQRIPLGVTTGTTREVRPLVLSPDEREAAFCDDGRARRVRLADPAKVTSLELEDVAVVSYRPDGTLRAARWSETVAETVLLGPDGAERERLPFALLAASAGDGAWLVARAPRAEGKPPVLEVLDAATRRTRATVATEPDARGLWSRPMQVELTPDGAHLLTNEDGRRLFVRDARTGRVLQRIFEYEEDRLVGFAVSPDGRSLITGGRRGGGENRDVAVLRWKRP